MSLLSNDQLRAIALIALAVLCANDINYVRGARVEEVGEGGGSPAH